MKVLSKAILLSCLLPICVIQLHSQSVAKCSDHAVAYSDAPKWIKVKMKLLTVKLPVGEPTVGRRVISPQGTAWFVEVDPDYMSTRVPWTTTLYVGGPGHPGVFFQASFKDHGNTFSARWLNEKLIFIQLWWGRIASSDIILDTSKQQFIYNELANYGELSEPCQ